MKLVFPEPSPVALDLDLAIGRALNRIPPLWPLKHFVAVNPFVGLSGQPFPEACALLERTAGAAPLLQPSEFLALYREGAITEADLAEASGPSTPPSRLIQTLTAASTVPASSALGTVADILDRKLPHAHWAVFVTEEISKFCATYFDENQTTWRSPWHRTGLFAAWRESARHDLNPEAFGLQNFRAAVASLPADPADCIAACLTALGAARTDPTDFLHRQLLTISGWAAYCQYLAREDTMRGRSNNVLRDLLAIRLAFDLALHRAFGSKIAFSAELPADADPAQNELLSALVTWQTAYELGYQRTLARQLAAAPIPAAAFRPSVQAVFCIDVRSEVFRRHLEAAAPTVATIGFAGFFGFPIAHRPLLADSPATRCPVLLVPPYESSDVVDPEASADEREAYAGRGAWKAFQNSAASCFAFVETAGLVFGASLTRQPRAAAPVCRSPVPALTGDESPSKLDALAAMCEGALRNMSLTANFGRLLLICGHGSTSANNPYASALDCGACGGHAGDVNARLAANALNHPGVRTRLAVRGIRLPADTWCIAGLHHTASDDVTLFELDRIPASHAADVAELRVALARAGESSRRERAPSLGLATTPPAELADHIRARSDDIAQVRPEWGLANNAAIIVAPRARSRALNLSGRTFLHDYDHAADSDAKVLDLILAAPVVVASWINLQYYASRVDPARYGSGNKVLHNVVGGLGVFEGNGGDLRPGLPLQSIHDGEKFMHEPRRLSVFVAAPRAKIELVLARQHTPRELLDHSWIHLFALEGARCFRYVAGGGWSEVT